METIGQIIEQLCMSNEISQVYCNSNMTIQYNTGGCPAAAAAAVSVRPSKILHPTCSAYISLNNGRILMFKVSKRPC